MATSIFIFKAHISYRQFHWYLKHVTTNGSYVFCKQNALTAISHKFAIDKINHDWIITIPHICNEYK